jgi:hypothetical protein
MKDRVYYNPQKPGQAILVIDKLDPMISSILTGSFVLLWGFGFVLIGLAFYFPIYLEKKTGLRPSMLEAYPWLGFVLRRK